MPDTHLIVPLDDKTAASFGKIAKASSMTEAELVRALIQDHIRDQEHPVPDDPEAYDKWFRDRVDEGIADADAGRVHSSEEVSAHFAARRAESLKKINGAD
jgi:predicted transcriptional regulator